ncbi:MAG: tetratricopeptide repeat protein [Chitinophagaceae bacterium]|nr:MAG: tetratricopeptide repeat protein [Chitinophagaceae bacterium]
MLRQFIAVFTFAIFVSACSNESQSASEVTVPTEERTMDSITTQIAKAKQLQEKGQYSEAMLIADAMIQKYPGQLDALSIKAEILKEQGKSAEALAIIEKAYAIQPRDKETAYNLAFEYADAKNAKALSLTDTLIKYDKTATVARAWYIKATYYNNTGNEKEALRYYDSSQAADFNFLDTYMDKGQLLFNQKKYDAALKTFALGQKFSPSTAEFYYWVAKCQEALGNKADAKANYERAFALNPSFTEAKTAAEKL